MTAYFFNQKNTSSAAANCAEAMFSCSSFNMAMVMGTVMVSIFSALLSLNVLVLTIVVDIIIAVVISVAVIIITGKLNRVKHSCI